MLQLGIGSSHIINVRGPLQDTGANVLSVARAGSDVRFNGDLSFHRRFDLRAGNTWFDGGSYTYSGDTIVNSDVSAVAQQHQPVAQQQLRFEGLNNGHTHGHVRHQRGAEHHHAARQPAVASCAGTAAAASMH